MGTNALIKWRPTWNVWIPFLLFLIPLILEDQMAGTLFTPFLYGLLLLIFGGIYYFRFRLWQAPVLALTTFLALCGYFMMARPERTVETFRLAGIPAGDAFQYTLEQYFTLPVWFALLVISFISFITTGKTLVHALELESAALKLFKLCARQITEDKNGYTGRPYTAGEHSLDKNQLVGFAMFMENKKIIVAEYLDNGIRMKFSMGVSPLNNAISDRVSWVTFDHKGSLSIFISQDDYEQYRRQYTFDQLCERMGNTFSRFAEYFVQNQEKRILLELKRV